jgi:hypothetical protein
MAFFSSHQEGAEMLRRGHRAAGLLLATSAIALSGAVMAGETVTYGYDSLGRLTKVSRSGTVNDGINASYSYDAGDNRTNVTVRGPGSAAGLPAVAGGGFESPDFGSGYGYAPAGPATFTGAAGIAGNGSAWGFAAAPEGDQVAFLQSGPAPAAISLQVGGLTPGARYAVSFRISARPGYPPIPVTVKFEGAALGTFEPTSTAFTAVTSAAFTASSATGTLSFTGIAAADDRSTGIDAVTVAAAGSN